MHLVNFERTDTHAPAKGAGSLSDAALGFEGLEPALPGSRRLGAVIQLGSYAGWVVDLNRMLAIKLAYDDVGAPEVEANSLVPPDLFSFLGLGASALEAAQIALDFAIATLDRYDAPDILRAGAVSPETRVKICAPLPRPGKIIGVANNYPDRGAASPGADELDAPALFLKAPSAVIGPHDEICLPASARQVDFQGELAVAIGTRAKNISETDALSCVAGYCVAVDVTARDLETGLEQSITVTATSGLTEEELRDMVAANQDHMVDVRTTKEFDLAKHAAETMLREIEGLFSDVQNIISGSDFGLDAVSKARKVCDEARRLIKLNNLAQLLECTEALGRTLNMFRGVVSKTRAE